MLKADVFQIRHLPSFYIGFDTDSTLFSSKGYCGQPNFFAHQLTISGTISADKTTDAATCTVAVATSGSKEGSASAIAAGTATAFPAVVATAHPA